MWDTNRLKSFFNDCKVMLPCEKAHWKLLPAIRKEYARIFIKEMGMSQKEVAKRLCISEAAVSHYAKNKRGRSGILNKEAKKFMNRLAKSGEKNCEKLLCSACKYSFKKGCCDSH